MEEIQIEKRFTDFYDAYHFLLSHELFEGRYHEALYVEVVKVDPETETVTFDEKKDTATRVWFEAGAPSVHDLNLDCGGETYEEATIELANLVYHFYGDKRTDKHIFRDRAVKY